MISEHTVARHLQNIFAIAHPVPTMTIDAIWRHDLTLPATQRFCHVARETARANGWIHESARA